MKTIHFVAVKGGERMLSGLENMCDGAKPHVRQLLIMNRTSWNNHRSLLAYVKK